MATARFGFKGSTEGCEDKATCTNMSLPSLRGDLFKLARSLAGSRSVRAQLHGKDVLLIPAMLPYVTQTTQKHQSANGHLPKICWNTKGTRNSNSNSKSNSNGNNHSSSSNSNINTTQHWLIKHWLIGQSQGSQYTSIKNAPFEVGRGLCCICCTGIPANLRKCGRSTRKWVLAALCQMR